MVGIVGSGEGVAIIRYLLLIYVALLMYCIFAYKQITSQKRISGFYEIMLIISTENYMYFIFLAADVCNV